MTTNTLTKKLTGKVAMVTGASRGFGAAIAKRLAQDGAAVARPHPWTGPRPRSSRHHHQQRPARSGGD